MRARRAAHGCSAGPPMVAVALRFETWDKHSTAEQNHVAGGYRFQPARRLQRAHLQVLSAVKHADVVVVLEGHPRKNKEKADLGASSTITQHDIIDGSYLHVILEESHDYSHSQGA